MSDFQLPQPVEQHARIAARAGKWNVACKFFMDPSQPPMELAATESVELHGQFFLISTFEAEMFGSPFKGITTMGYDTVQNEYQATWADTMSPHLYYFRGTYDEDGKVLTMTTRAPGPGNGPITNWRTTETSVDADTHVFCMYCEMPGIGEIQLIEHTYRRA